MGAMRAQYSSRLLVVLVVLVAVACRKEKTESAPVIATVSAAQAQQSAAAARKSLDALVPAFSALNEKLGALHREYDPLPPGLPGFGETRSRFYAFSVALGAMSSKPAWLTGRLDAAAKARDGAELAAIEKDIAETRAQLEKADERAAQLLQEVKPFKDEAAIRFERAQALGKASCE